MLIIYLLLLFALIYSDLLAVYSLCDVHIKIDAWNVAGTGMLLTRINGVCIHIYTCM